MEIEKKFEELGKAFEDFKKLNDDRIKKNTSDLVEKTEKANAEITRLQEEIKAMQTAAARTQHGGSQGDEKGQRDEKAAKYKEAFAKWAKGQINDVELKAMSVDSDEDGGFLVTPEVSSEIVKKVFESSPMRQVASVQSISTDSLEILEDLDEVASGWVTETQARAATNTSKIKKIAIPVHELHASPTITQKLLDDANLNVEAWLQEKVASKFARDEATAFISGDGVGKPKGILTYSAGDGFGLLEQVNSGHASQITADGLISLQAALFEAYQGNASWMMKRATVAEVRKLKDSQNRYLWEPSLVPGTPDMLLGKAIYQAADMEATGANKLAVAYGDFRAGYQIVDRVGIRVLRDPYTAKPYVLFYTTKRVGGAVKNFQAIKIGKCAV
jgi:HK97 family phage major capsid protein